MSPVLRIVAAVVGILSTFVEWLKASREAKAARRQAEADIIIENERRAREASDIVAEQRSRDDVVDRLRKRDF